MFRPMVDKPPAQKKVAVVITGGTPLPPAEGANFFHFTTLGPEVQLLVGTVNLLRLHEAKTTDDPSAVVPEITHRFLLSPIGFAALKQQMATIEQKVSPVPGIVSEMGSK